MVTKIDVVNRQKTNYKTQVGRSNDVPIFIGISTNHIAKIPIKEKIYVWGETKINKKINIAKIPIKGKFYVRGGTKINKKNSDVIL